MKKEEEGGPFFRLFSHLSARVQVHVLIEVLILQFYEMFSFHFNEGGGS